MRYKEGHKERTRRRIIEAASRGFRKDGVEALGVAGLMAEAGLTHGGFYAHFKSKEDLFCETLATALAGTTAEFERIVRKADDGLEAIVRGYVSTRHRDNPQTGCAGASLAPEAARRSKRTRRVFAQSIAQTIDLIAAQLPFADTAARRRRAIAIFSLMMGALQLARAEPDPVRSKEILDSAIEAALSVGRSSAP